MKNIRPSKKIIHSLVRFDIYFELILTVFLKMVAKIFIAVIAKKKKNSEVGIKGILYKN